MKKPIIDLKKLIYNKRFLITLSVIISVVVWFVAMVERNPIREQTFSDVSVSVSVENTSAQSLGLGIVSDVSSYKFTVKISGPNYIVSTIKNTDFILSASVDEVNAPGTYSLDVTGSRNSYVSGYNFVSIEPSTIDVTFDYFDTKTYKITPKIVGVSASEGLVAETPIVSNKDQETITIKGPRETLNKIYSVGALTELSKNTVLSSSQTYDSDIVLYDENGDVLYRYESGGSIFDSEDKKIESTPLTLSFTSIKITQPISKKATFDVNINFTNIPSGIDISGILSPSVDHRQATVLGSPEVVEKMQSIELSAIDFKDISASSTGEFEVTPSLPEGIKLVDNIEYFKVKLDLSNLADKTFNITDIKYNGLSSGLSAKSSTVKNVKICGPKSVIEKLKSSDIYAEIDLSDKTAGEHTSEVSIKSYSYSDIWQVGSYSSSVTISNK